MRFTKLKTNQEVSECLILHLSKNKITKKHIEKSMGVSYPTILKFIDNPGSLKYSQLVLLCKVIDIDIIELITKY